MDKEQIFSTLKEKLGNTSFSDRSLTTYVENNLPGEGVEPDDAYFDKHIGILKSFQGQFNSDVSASVASQLDTKVAEYYSKNPDKLKEYIKAHPELLTTTPPLHEKNEELETLKSEFQQMKQMLAKQKTEKSEAEMRGKVAEKMNAKIKKENLIINNALWEDALKEAEIKEGQSVEDLYNSAKDLYESKFKRVFGEDGAEPFKKTQGSFIPPTGNGAVKSFFEKKAKREGWNKK